MKAKINKILSKAFDLTYGKLCCISDNDIDELYNFIVSIDKKYPMGFSASGLNAVIMCRYLYMKGKQNVSET